MNACTIVARNYLPFARVIAQSLIEHQPSARFNVLVVDDDDRSVADDDEVFEILRPVDIGLSMLDVHRMAAMYDVTEFSTALKPLFLRALRERFPPTIVYLDPDIWVHAPLEDLAELAHSRGIVLTPHRTVPLDPDDQTPTEGDLLSAGVFNLGFIALGPGTEPFLEWWATRLRFDAVRAIAQNLFTDQRSIDLVPALYPHAIVRDEGCNVAYWNLDKRDLAWTGERYEVNGAPLRFFHFSGFRPENPDVLTFHHAANPRVRLSERPVVAKICGEYARLLGAAGYGTHTYDYAYDRTPTGLPVDGVMRRAYRQELQSAERGDAHPPPDPFDVDSGPAFVDWLNEPTGGTRSRPLSRYLMQLHRSNAYLRSTFQLSAPYDVERYVDWVDRWGRFEYRIPDEVAPPRVHRARSRSKPPRSPEGVNVAAYFRAETGVGEAGRAVLRAVQAAGLPHRVIAHDVTLSRQQHPFSAPTDDDGALYDTNIVCVNADAFPGFARQMGSDFFRDRYTIGVWHWEVESFPWEMHNAFRHVQEVWMASEFSRQAVAKVAPCPVFAFPIPIESVQPRSLPRGAFGLAEGFMFLFIFDYLSVFNRKNPVGLVEAFRQAFAPGEGPLLVIKSINGDQDPTNREILRASVQDRPDISLLEDYFDHGRTKDLMAACDCYVSLHRSEGFGLTMAEAMSIGKPVIATGYSGNLEFMNRGNSYLVLYRLTSVGPGSPPYPAEARWAEPDLKEAASLMRRVCEHPDEAAGRGSAAQRDIALRHGPEARAAFLTERLEVGRRLSSLGLRPGSVGSDPLLPRNRATRAVAQVPARIALRAMTPVIEAVRRPSYRHRRAAALAKRLLRRPYEAIWRAGHSPSDTPRGDV